MRTTSLFLWVIVFGVLPVTNVFSQDSSTDNEYYVNVKNAISFLPHYAAIKGIRIDYERKLRDKNNWIVFAPQMYIDMHENNYYSNSYLSYESMTGYGLNLYYKVITYGSQRKNIFCDQSRYSIYLIAGPNFQHYNLKNTEEVVTEFVENGITYLKFEQQEVTKYVNRYGAVVDVGLQFALERFLFDIYFGAGFKYSIDKNGNILDSKRNLWVDKDYSGMFVDSGLRVGYFF